MLFHNIFNTLFLIGFISNRSALYHSLGNKKSIMQIRDGMTLLNGGCLKNKIDYLCAFCHIYSFFDQTI